MKIQTILENISADQRRVGQLPADFEPPNTSPQLSGPYPGQNATRGYLVGEGEDSPQYYALVHKVTNTPLSTHRDLESARDAWRGLAQDQRPFYQVRSTRTPPRDWNMTSEGSLAEFAPGGPDGGGGDDGFDDETLRRLAAQWLNGDEDPRVEKALAAAGWEIGQDEGYDDEPGVFVVQSGDVNGHSFMSWPAPELRQLMNEATGDRQFDDMMRQIKKGTKKQATADRRERERQSREQARAAFGPSPADRLSIRSDKGVSEMDSQGYRGHRGDEDPGKGPEKSVRPAKAKDVAKDAEKDLAKAMDREHAKKKEQGVAEEGYGNHPSQRVDPRTGKKYVPPKSPLGQGVAEASYNPLDLERREQQRMDQERAQFKRDELEAELGGEEQRAQTIMSGTWYVVIDGQVWKRQGEPVTFSGRDAARRAGQTIKNRDPQKTVTITTELPAMREATTPGSVVNDQGMTQAQWMKQHQSQGARIIQSKMVNGPAFARYPDGRQETWRADKNAMTETRDKKHHWIYETNWSDADLASGQDLHTQVQNMVAQRPQDQLQAQKPSAAQSGQAEFVAPHGDAANELRMFQAGSKPAAVINTPDVGIWNDIIRSGRYVVQRLLGQDGQTAGYVVGQPGEDERVEKIHALVQNASNRAHQGDFRAYENSNYHRWLGRLLGYPTDKIEAFIKNYFRDTPDRARARYDEDYVEAFRESLAEGMAVEDILGSMRQKLGDYFADVARTVRQDRSLGDRRSRHPDKLGPAVRRMRTHDGSEIHIHGNEDDGFRITVRGRTMPTGFPTLAEAEIATELYCARRRQRDYQSEA